MKNILNIFSACMLLEFTYTVYVDKPDLALLIFGVSFAILAELQSIKERL